MEEVTSRQLAVVRFIFSRIFPLPFVVGGACLLYFGIKNALDDIKSRSWPTATATVTSSSVRRYISSAARGRTQHQAQIQFQFVVQERRFNASHCYESPNAGKPTRLVAQYPVGKQITVYYRPDNPGECRLFPGFEAESCLGPLGGLIFLAAGLLMAIFLPGLMGQREANP